MCSDGFVKGVVRRIASNGCGVLQDNGGGNLFVEGAAPNEIIACKKTAGNKAELVEIIEPSADRVRADCPHYGLCGGCGLRHISYEAQIREKVNILQNAFLYSGGINDFPQINVYRHTLLELAAGTRDRAQFHCSELRGSYSKKKFGFMARSSNNVIEIEDCPALNGTLRTAIKGLAPPIDRDRWNVYGRGGVFISEGGAKEQAEFSFSAGQKTINLAVDAGLFFQNNGIMLERLIESLLSEARLAVSESCSGSPSSGDFYCGTGVFAAFFAGLFSSAGLLEINKNALDLARRNLSGIKTPFKAKFYADSDTAWVKKHGAKAGTYCFLCVDPGRGGLSPVMRQWICAHKPESLAYVSCEPSSLARDSRSLLESGFRMERLSFFDFYPHTPHIECLAVFNGKNLR